MRVGVVLATFGSLCIVVKFGFVCIVDTLKGLRESYISHPPLQIAEKDNPKRYDDKSSCKITK